MGCFDTIHVWQKCPYCKRFVHFDAQTHDLGRMMYSYTPLWESWYDEGNVGTLLGRKFRLSLKVYPAFPFDKAHTAWKNQAERAEAEARVLEKFNKLKFVKVIADCHSAKCQTFSEKKDIKRQGSPSGFGRAFYGKIKIKKGLLFGKIYDIRTTRGRTL